MEDGRFGIVRVMKFEIPCKGDIEITNDGSILIYQITKSGEKKGMKIPKENGIADEYREVFNEGKTIGDKAISLTMGGRKKTKDFKPGTL